MNVTDFVDVRACVCVCACVCARMVQIEVATLDACIVNDNPDFGDPPTAAEIATQKQFCRSFMGGVMTGGEFAGFQFFIDFVRVLGSRMVDNQALSPQVLLAWLPSPQRLRARREITILCERPS